MLTAAHMAAGCMNPDVRVTTVADGEIIIRRYDLLCNSVTGSFIGPIDAGALLGGGNVKAVWIDPLSEVDFAMAITGNAPSVVGSDANANLTGAISTNTPPDTLGLNPWFEWFLLGSGQGMTFGVGAPLVMDLRGSLFIVPRQGPWGLGSVGGGVSLPFRGRLSVAVAWNALPSDFPVARAPIQASVAGNPVTANPMTIRLPSMSRRSLLVTAQNFDAANALNIKVRLWKSMLTSAGNTNTALSGAQTIPAGNGNSNIWDFKDFFPNTPMPDWVQVEASGPSTSATASLELRD